MKCKIFFLSILLLLLSSASSQAQCRLDKSHWQVILDEEFNEPNVSDWLDVGVTVGGVQVYNAGTTKNWVLGSIPYGVYDLPAPPLNLTGPGCTYDQSAISMDGNNANFGTSISGGEGFTSLICTTYDDFTPDENPGPPRGGGTGFMYGMFEIRCKLPRGKQSPCFWLAGSCWPPEIDAFEHHDDADSFFCTVHWSDGTGTPQGCSTHFTYKALDYFNFYDEFHTYTIVWTPSEITWFFDGIELKTDADPTHLSGPGSPLFPSLTSTSPDVAWQWFFLWAKQHLMVNNTPTGITGTEQPFVVDYVKVYKPVGNFTYHDKWLINSDYKFQQYYNDQVSLYNATPYKSSQDWVSNVIENTGYSPVAVVNNLTGFNSGASYMYKGPYDLLWCTYWSSTPSPGFYSVPMDWSHNVTGDVALANNGFRTFYSYSGQIWYYESGVFTKIAPIGNAISGVTTPNIIANNSGNEIFYIGLVGFGHSAIFHAVYSGGSWSVNQISTTFSGTLQYMTARPTLDQIYYVSGGGLWVTYLWGGSWITSNITVATSVSSNLSFGPAPFTGHDAIFYRDASNELKYCEWTGVGFSDNYFKAHMWGGSALTNVYNVSMNNILAGTDPTNRQYYYVGTDKRPYALWLSGSEYVSTPIDIDQPNVAGDFKLVSFGYTAPDFNLSWRGSDNAIRTLKYGACDFTDNLCSRYIKKQTTQPIDTTYKIVKNGDISLFPNPTSGKTYIYLDGKHWVRRIVLTFLDGRQKEISTTMSQNDRIELDLTNEKNGFYTVTVYTDSETKTFKLVKS